MRSGAKPVARLHMCVVRTPTAGRYVGREMGYVTIVTTKREPSESRVSICVLTHFHSLPQVLCLLHLAG